MTGWEAAASASFEIEPSLLSLPYTLGCGQAFRWQLGGDGWWTGVVRGRAMRLRRDGGTILAQVYPSVADVQGFVASYLRLDVDLAALYRSFASADPRIAAAISSFAGLRLLAQEAQETLLSYVCSTANSVPRISRSVEEISRRYGRFIGSLSGSQFYAFPSADSLAEVPEDELRNGCGLGWRGANLKRVAEELATMPDGWPEQLRHLPYQEAKQSLMRLRGIGAKIADCVCLFALGKDQAVPVDRHIWAVAREIFGAEVPTRTLTSSTYETVARLFMERYGRYAGWAQEYLYLQRRAATGKAMFGQKPSP